MRIRVNGELCVVRITKKGYERIDVEQVMKEEREREKARSEALEAKDKEASGKASGSVEQGHGIPITGVRTVSDQHAIDGSKSPHKGQKAYEGAYIIEITQIPWKHTTSPDSPVLVDARENFQSIKVYRAYAQFKYVLALCSMYMRCITITLADACFRRSLPHGFAPVTDLFCHHCRRSDQPRSEGNGIWLRMRCVRECLGH